MLYLARRRHRLKLEVERVAVAVAAALIGSDGSARAGLAFGSGDPTSGYIQAILCGVAKVLISIPDDVLRGLDQHARDSGATRSGLLRELVQRELEAAERARTGEVRRLLSRPGRHGGDAAAAVRELRRSR